MKKRVILTGLLMLGTLALYWLQFTSPHPVLATASTMVPTPLSAAVREAMQASEELTTKWLTTLNSEGWLFVSYKDETFLGDQAIDPDTGWPLPEQSIWENWYMLDENGQQTAVISQRTDLERGNVIQSIWQDGMLLRLPSNVKDDTRVTGRAWESFKPLQDHFCNTKISSFVYPPTDGINQEIESKWEVTGEGKKQWVLTMSVYYPPVADAFKDIVVIGNQDICYRSEETGAVEHTEHFIITDKNERILLSRTYDYITVRVKEPPADIVHCFTF